jgi:hypothetical protein
VPRPGICQGESRPTQTARAPQIHRLASRIPKNADGCERKQRIPCPGEEKEFFL